ncbi:MAG: hypothetical protein ACI8ZN_001251 [Bacteroidia bacterium]|jgi:hypothetical protein
MELLAEINEEHYTTEIARFNLEINLDPFEFTGNCFERLKNQLILLLEKGRRVADRHDTKFLLTGIAPTLSKDFLHFEYMTPNI